MKGAGPNKRARPAFHAVPTERHHYLSRIRPTGGSVAETNTACRPRAWGTMVCLLGVAVGCLPLGARELRVCLRVSRWRWSMRTGVQPTIRNSVAYDVRRRRHLHQRLRRVRANLHAICAGVHRPVTDSIRRSGPSSNTLVPALISLPSPLTMTQSASTIP